MAGTIAQPQAFGRFGFTQLPVVPGFVIESEGFRARCPGSDRFSFQRPLTYRRVRCTPEEAAYDCGQYVGNPQSIHVSLRAPGFEATFPMGVDLKLSSLSGPNLTVPGATYGPGTPAPASSWVLVSFSDKQPPVLVSFLGQAQELTIDGKSGDWHLTSKRFAPVRLRFSLPFGVAGRTANDVGTLGELAKAIEASPGLWTRESPKLTAIEYDSDEKGMTVVWKFDRAGALVPPAAILAKRGGDKLETGSPVLALDIGTEEGPYVFAQSTAIKVRFPMRRIPLGRSVGFGSLSYAPPSHAPLLQSETVELALANLVGSRGQNTWDAGSRALEEFFTKTAFAVEQASQSRLTYGGEGEGMELTASNALLMESLSMSQGKDRGKNSLLNGLLWRVDPMAWRLWTNGLPQRRADALASLAGAMDSDDDVRATAAMMEAGLAASAALKEFCDKHGYALADPGGANPMSPLRRSLFTLEAPLDPFLGSLLSDVRILSGQALKVSGSNEKLELAFPYRRGDDKVVVLSVGSPVTVRRGRNIKKSTLSERFGIVTFRFEPAVEGECSLTVQRAKWAPALPSAVPVPKYSE